jgi:hypothetical protein
MHPTNQRTHETWQSVVIGQAEMSGRKKTGTRNNSNAVSNLLINRNQQLTTRKKEHKNYVRS